VNGLADETDLPILGAAVSSGADYLITGDSGLFGIGKIGNAEIVSPRVFRERIRSP
jgi:predicted nucleic acid-binding protein